MELKLVRNPSTEQCTIGVLSINGEFFCDTLEDVVREVKIPGETAIPAGRYKIEITESARFKRKLPILLDVPGFTGIRIHPGNTDADTEGCVLVGQWQKGDSIINSRVTFNTLIAHLELALEAGEEVWVEVS